MTISSYYNKNGRVQPTANLMHAHSTILDKIRTRKATTDLKNIEDNLNVYSYGLDIEGMEISESQRQAAQYALSDYFDAVSEAANHTKNRTAADSIDIGDKSTYVSRIGEIVNNITEITKKQHMASKNQSKITIKVLERTIQQIQSNKDDLIKEALKGNLTGIVEQLNVLDTVIRSIGNDLTEIKKRFPNLEKDKIQDRYALTTSSKDTLRGKNSQLAANIRTLFYLASYLNCEPPTTDEIGDMGEAMVTLVRDIINTGTIYTKDAALENIKKDIAGFSRTNTSNKVEITVSDDFLLSIDTTKKRNYWGGKVYGKFFDRDFVVNTYVVDTEAKRQVKADVVFGGEANDARASVKNWSGWKRINDFGEYVDRSLGIIPILTGVFRSNDNSEALVQDYIYALQDNHKKYSKEGAKTLKKAHNFAKASIVADIALGYSQIKEKSDANVLIINQRSERRWYVLDLTTAVENVILGRNTFLYLDGYDESKLEDEAWNLMKHITSLNNNIQGKSLAYRSMMYQILHWEKVSILVDPKKAKREA